MATTMPSMELQPVMAKMLPLNHMEDDIEIRVQREVSQIDHHFQPDQIHGNYIAVNSLNSPSTFLDFRFLKEVATIRINIFKTN